MLQGAAVRLRLVQVQMVVGQLDAPLLYVPVRGRPWTGGSVNGWAAPASSRGRASAAARVPPLESSS